jgi:streptogramin lyase
MAVGSDGNVWFGGAEDHGTTFPPFIRRMTPAGVFTTIPVPAGLTIGRMISGPDGGVWFSGEKGAETHINFIGRITLDGQFTTFSTPSQSRDAGVQDFCVGPDNAIWYTWVDSFGDLSKVTGRIGRVSPSGQIQVFTVPYAPGSIASGADGALWYSEFAHSATGDDLARKGYIGRITTAGVASELPIDLNVSISQVATGSDGAIWYSVDGDQSGAFGRITPSGGVKKFTTGGNAQIYLIAAVPGALWLFDSRNNLWHYRLPA